MSVENYRLTPKVYLVAELESRGIPRWDAEEVWFRLEAFCIKQATEDCKDDEYAALIFDGAGGVCIGANTAPKSDGEEWRDA